MNSFPFHFQKWALSFFLIFVSSYLQSQNFVLSGYLLDSTSNERLIGGYIKCNEFKIGTYTDEHGFFSLQLPKSPVNISYGSAGYVVKNTLINLSKDSLTQLYLTPLSLSTVEITAEEIGTSDLRSTQMSSITISALEAEQMPALAGEVDILKVLQLMPGVQGGNEGNSGLYVRGGGADQNLILLDGVPIYNPTHLFGFLSNFNTDAISHIELIKGGFPARYGGRLSSALDIRLKDGNMKEFSGKASIGLLSSKLTLEGPLKNKKASYIVSARYSYPNLYINPISRFATRVKTDEMTLYDVLSYQFYDLNGKINYRPTDKDRIQLSLFHGRDRGLQKGFFQFNSKTEDLAINEISQQDFGWSNSIGSLQWHHIFSGKWALNTTLYYNRYNLQNNLQVESSTEENGSITNFSQEQLFSSGIEDYALKFDALFAANSKHQLRMGGQVIYHEFLVGTKSFSSMLGQNQNDTVLSQPMIPALESSAYIEDDWKITDALALRAGVHYANFAVRDTTYSSIQPRLALRWLVNEKLSLKASWAVMAQYLHLLTNSGVGLPTDLWVPPTENILPQQSWQTAIGGVYQVTNGYSFSLEGYYNQLSNISEYREGTDFVEVSENWEDQVVQGRGWNYGVEALLRKSSGKLTGWVGYTLAWANRQSDELNFGEIYPYKFDRRHDIGLAMTYQWKKNIQVSGNWVFGSGNVTTLPTVRYGIQTPYYSTTESIVHYEGRNNFRMPSYHRLDLSISFTKEKKQGERIWTFGLYNAYNRQNPFFLEIGPDRSASYQPGEPQPSFVWQQSLFPILPSISYKFSF